MDINYVKREGQEEEVWDKDDTVWTEGGPVEVHRKSSVLKGYRGLHKNERGHGARILREHLGPARLALMKDSPYIDENTARVDIKIKYMVEGIDQDCLPLEVARSRGR